MTLDRRRFIATVGAALMAPPRIFAATIPRLGAKLYTVRTEMEKDFNGTLAKVAALGYPEVEFAGTSTQTPAAGARRPRSATRLTAPSCAHRLREPERRQVDARARGAHTIGHKYLVNAWVDEPIRNQPDAWQRIAGPTTSAGETSKRAGIQFAYHNHNFEFAPPPVPAASSRSNTCSRHAITSASKSSWTCAQITLPRRTRSSTSAATPEDSQWCTSRGCARCGLHGGERRRRRSIESSPRSPTWGRDDTIDWKRTFAQSKTAGIRHYFIEHDIPKQPFESLKASHNYLSRLEF